MQKYNSSNETRADGLAPEFSSEDLAKLFNYPSIGQLFSESDGGKLENFLSQLNATNENLERVIRYGNQAEAEKAARTARAVKITLEFLNDLRQMQTENKR